MRKWIKENYQFYSNTLFQITITILIMFYQSNLFTISLIILIMQILGIGITYVIVRKFGQMSIKWADIITIIVHTIFMFYFCFQDQISELVYLLIKMYELKLVNYLNSIQTFIIFTLFNLGMIAVFIYQQENPIAYVILAYSIIVIYSQKYEKSITKNNEHPEEIIQTSRDPQNINILQVIDDSLSKMWFQRMEQIPIGIIIVKKQDLQIVFKNGALFHIFCGNSNIEQYLMDEIEFVIVVKRRTKLNKETSIKLKTMQYFQTINNQNSQIKLMLNSVSLPTTLRSILTELNLGNLNSFLSNDNHLELSATIQRNRITQLQQEDEDRNLKLKLYYSPDQPEILIIIDDITTQTQLQKLEQRQKFQGKLVNSFSHELRTPLNSAQLFLQALLKEPEIDDNLKENYLTPASNSLKLQAYLIRDIIDFTQFHQSKIQYQYSQFAFEDIVQEISDIFKPLFKLKKLGLHINVKNTINPIINSDFKRLMQIFVNCLQNSIKFSQKGIISIEVTGIDNIVSFAIKDQGSGIDVDHLKEIQEQLSSISINRDIAFHDNWQGLGLLVSQINLIALAPQNKAQLKIESKGLNQGTKVSFQIRTSQASHTQIFMQKTLVRPSLRSALTVPDLGFGIQGILVITSPKIYDADSPRLQHVPTYNRHSVANYFRPSQQIGQLINQDTDIQEEEVEKLNIGKKLSNLQYQVNEEHRFIEYLDTNLQQIHEKKQIQRYMSIKSDKQIYDRANTLLSRIHMREEQEQKMEEQFEKIQYDCKCNYVLSVDDDSFNQQALQFILGQMGFKLVIAYNGVEALKKLKKMRSCSSQCTFFNFILMDCQMPIMDGWQTTEILTEMMQNHEIPTIPVIGLTAFNGQAELQRCYDVGMKEVLSKPLQVHELKQALLKVLK